MGNLPPKCVVDTNVPKTANLARTPNAVPDELSRCVLACVEAIDHVVKNRALVLDSGDEIFDEYRRELSMSGQPGVGDGFMKWVHDNRWTLQVRDRVVITACGTSYREFPTSPDLRGFDQSDRKFVAVANKHPDRPPILQATDSKWWGWKDALASAGIAVQFLCPDYVECKYKTKFKE